MAFEQKERISLNLARFKKAGKTFELVIDPEQALAYLEGKDINLDDVLKSQEIFVDAQKGMVASDEELQDVFQTTNKERIVEVILKEGEIQLTAELRKKFREQKKKRIIYLIHKSVIDPRTHLPHPVNRIEMALEQAKVHIKETKSAEEQLDDIIKALKPILPIKFELKKIELSIPATEAGKVYGKMKSMITIEQEQWANDGSLHIVTTIPSAVEQELYDMLNGILHGSLESKVLEIITK